MSLSRRHFVALADILKEHDAPLPLVLTFADWCEEESRTFDRERFVVAAGYTPT